MTKIDIHKQLLNFDEICIDLSFVYQLKQMFSKIKATRIRKMFLAFQPVATLKKTHKFNESRLLPRVAIDTHCTKNPNKKKNLCFLEHSFDFDYNFVIDKN